MVPPSHLIPGHALLLLPSIFPSIRELIQWVDCIKWPKSWSFSFSISPSNEYSGLFLLRLTGLISLLSKGLSKVFSSTTVRKHQFFGTLPSLYMMAGKTIALSIQIFVGRVTSLLFNSLSIFVIASLPRSNHLLNSWLQSPSTVLLEPKKRKSCHCFHPFPSICHYLMELDAIFLVFWIFNFKRSSFTLIKQIFSSSLLSATGVVSSAYLRLLIYLLPTLTLGVGDGQGSLACCSPWSRKESDTTEWTGLNWTELILIPVCNSSSLAFCMMWSAYKLNKQGDNKQPWLTPFSVLNQLIAPCKVLTVASWAANRFLRKQVRWSGCLISLRVFHSLLWFTQANALA